MKVFAIASIPSNVALEEVRKHLPDEVPATLKLYLEEGRTVLVPRKYGADLLDERRHAR